MRHTVSLKQNHQFRSLYARGKNAAGVYLVLYARKNRAGVSRLGIAASTKLGNAVKRNRARRRLKEAYRLNETGFSKGVDLVIAARSRVIDAPFDAVCGELLRLGRKLGIYETLSGAVAPPPPRGEGGKSLGSPSGRADSAESERGTP